MAFIALKPAGGSAIFNIFAMEIVTKIVTRFSEWQHNGWYFSIEARDILIE